MIKEVTTFISEKADLEIGTYLFAGHRPQDAPDACDCVLEASGGSVEFDLPERADPVFQVLSRATTYFTARARAWAVYDAIFRKWTYGSAGWILDPLEVGGDKYEIMIIEPMAIPQYIGQDENGRYEFSTNYLMRIKKL